MSNTPSIEVLTLQLQVTRLQAELIAAQSEIGRYRHQEALQKASQLQQAIQAAKQRAAEPAPAVDEAMQAELARIAKAGADDLPQIVARQMPGDAGQPMLVTQNGQPLTVIERAILDRQAELRRQAGG
ncbi:MAG: hypothetical protein MUC68_10380 [Burkholderiaceae bacterium]|jgi:hypothetical protein|nr:hypothetical protein [Burkholderiaceae bacterium]